MMLCIPTQDGHDWVRKVVDSLVETVRGDDFRLLIVDNASTEPFAGHQFLDVPFPVRVVRNDVNRGFYYPILQALEAGPREELVGVAHNDLVYYEVGWNQRMAACFAADGDLALVGVCGSSEADAQGGRGGGTMCNFRGLAQAQPGLRVHGLEPAVVLDSQFMMFRASAVHHVETAWSDVALAHFHDRIWPLRAVYQGLHVGVLGMEVDHWGGTTIVANASYREDCRRWFLERPHLVPPPGACHGDVVDYGHAMYLLGEDRLLSEFCGRLPCRVSSSYGLCR